MKLAEYNFKIIYKKGKSNSNADALSRVQRQQENEEIVKEDFIEFLKAINSEKFIDKIEYSNKDIENSKIQTVAFWLQKI